MLKKMDSKNKRQDTKYPHKSALKACYTIERFDLTIDIFTLCTITKQFKQSKFYSNFVQVSRIFRNRISKKFRISKK